MGTPASPQGKALHPMFTYIAIAGGVAIAALMCLAIIIIVCRSANAEKDRKVDEIFLGELKNRA